MSRVAIVTIEKLHIGLRHKDPETFPSPWNGHFKNLIRQDEVLIRESSIQCLSIVPSKVPLATLLVSQPAAREMDLAKVIEASLMRCTCQRNSSVCGPHSSRSKHH